MIFKLPVIVVPLKEGGVIAGRTLTSGIKPSTYQVPLRVFEEAGYKYHLDVSTSLAATNES